MIVGQLPVTSAFQIELVFALLRQIIGYFVAFGAKIVFELGTFPNPNWKPVKNRRTSLVSRISLGSQSTELDPHRQTPHP